MDKTNSRQGEAKRARGFQQQWKRTVEQLRGQRDKLRSELSSNSMSPDELVNGWQDRDSPSESALRDVEFGHRSKVNRQIVDIGRALERIEAGTYGLCDSCKQRIDPTRLLDEPEALFCFACQSMLEGENVAWSTS